MRGERRRSSILLPSSISLDSSWLIKPRGCCVMLYTGGGVMLYRVKFGRFRRNYRPSLVRRLETLHILQPISLPVTPLFPLSSWLIALSRVARITLYSALPTPLAIIVPITLFPRLFDSWLFPNPRVLYSIRSCYYRHLRADWREGNISLDIPAMIENDVTILDFDWIIEISRSVTTVLYMDFVFSFWTRRTDLNNNLSQTVIIIELFFGYLDLVEIARVTYTKRRNSSVWSELHFGVENDFSRIETLRNNVTRKEKKISRSA